MLTVNGVDVLPRACPTCGNSNCEMPYMSVRNDGRVIGRTRFGCGADQEITEDGKLIVHGTCRQRAISPA